MVAHVNFLQYLALESILNLTGWPLKDLTLQIVVRLSTSWSDIFLGTPLGVSSPSGAPLLGIHYDWWSWIHLVQNGLELFRLFGIVTISQIRIMLVFTTVADKLKIKQVGVCSVSERRYVDVIFESVHFLLRNSSMLYIFFDL